MTLRERRVKFTRLLADLLIWIRSQGWEVALDEGTIHSPRAARKGVQRIVVEDAVHTKGSKHHSGEAADLLLYDDLDGDGEDDDYIADGDDPRWIAIARQWESMDPLCTSGIRWHDANHVSFGEGSKAVSLDTVLKGE